MAAPDGSVGVGPVAAFAVMCCYWGMCCVLLLLLFYVYLKSTSAAPEIRGEERVISREWEWARGCGSCFVGSAVPDRHIFRMDLVLK